MWAANTALKRALFVAIATFEAFFRPVIPGKTKRTSSEIDEPIHRGCRTHIDGLRHERAVGNSNRRLWVQKYQGLIPRIVCLSYESLSSSEDRSDASIHMWQPVVIVRRQRVSMCWGAGARVYGEDIMMNK